MRFSWCFLSIFPYLCDGLLVNVTHRPTVIWHSMGDDCCGGSMGRIKNLLASAYPGIYVYSVRIGDSVVEDTERSYVGFINDQIDYVCDLIVADSQLGNGFDLVGFSQGGLLSRGLVERCGHEVHVHNLVSVGGPQQGVFGLPNCPQVPHGSKFCEYVRRLLELGAYDQIIQNRLIQAQFWHDPFHESEYRRFSKFLSDINNEIDVNESYKTNLLNLSNFALVKFLQDTTVIPRESEWFGFYAPGQDQEIVTLQEIDLYIEDRLGLKAMNEAGKLKFFAIDGDHLQFTDEWFISEIIQPYLGGTI